MAKFIIQETEEVFMTFEYEIEAETKEEAIDKYINELAGCLDPLDSYPSDGSEEKVDVI